MHANVNNYFESLTGLLKYKNSVGDISEHAPRSALQTLLEAAANTVNPQLQVEHEPKKQGPFGRPDFKIYAVAAIIGYVETKPIGTNLNPLLKSEQILKYRQLSDNLLLTDYCSWIWMHGTEVQRLQLCHPEDLLRPRFKPDASRMEEVWNLLQAYFSVVPSGVARPKELADALAVRTRLLRDFLREELQLQEQNNSGEQLLGLYHTFQKNIFHDLNIDEFADAFAQTLGYGLFLARLNTNLTVDLHNVTRFIPSSFQLINELVDFLKHLDKPVYRNVRWVVEEVLFLMNHLDLETLQKALSFRKWQPSLPGVQDDPYGRKDPYVYFYENFLAAYDSKLRKSRGVYYTPPPVVNFIVRGTDEILRDIFGIEQGLADHKRVTVLDFACGTGTFLLEIYRQIFERVPKGGKRDLLLKEHLLKNLHGFEMMIAPYTIAHLKLSQFLRDQDCPLSETERLPIWLTNTLDPADSQLKLEGFPALAEETRQAQKVKNQPILVITGNPPYAGHSRNPSERTIEETIIKGKNKGQIRSRKIKTWIGELMSLYKEGLNEKNPKWLQDDYVKFLRFAQWKMEQVEEGIVAVITNHSFLDNPTFRVMRQSLMQTFDQLWFLDLHGNLKKKEKTPDGGKDDNVFDIEQGVAISFLIKKSGLERKILHADFWGPRKTKYELCLKQTLQKIEWQELQPQSPFYLFVPLNTALLKKYDKGWKVTDIFSESSVGIVTARDKLTIQQTKEKMLSVVHDFSKLSIEFAREKYKLGPDARDWKVELAQKDLQDSGLEEDNIVEICYRPFDKQFTYFTGKSRGFHCMPRGKIMSHLLKPNLALAVGRQGQVTGEAEWNLVTVGDGIADFNLFYRGGIQYFPLYLYDTPGGEGGLFEHSGAEPERRENFSAAFRAFLDERYGEHLSPETVLGYIYGVLHTPTYRKRFAEFLRIDFPRIPFPETGSSGGVPETFLSISALGNELIEAHLLRKIPHNISGAQYQGVAETPESNHLVEKIAYTLATDTVPSEGKLKINATQYFAPLCPEVFAFRVGGYQPLEKYLKDRKGRTLSLSEIENVENMSRAIGFTLKQMRKLDEVMGEWI